MRKPKFLAMTLALALVAGTVLQAPVTVRAEETVAAAPSESQGDKPTPSPAPTDFEVPDPEKLEWVTETSGNDRWCVGLTVPNSDALAERNGRCYITLYKDGEAVSAMLRYYFTAGGGFSSSIMESGSYKFSVYVEAEVDGEVKRSNEVFSPEQVYTAPEQRLGTVQDIVWDEERTGVFYFTPLEDDVSQYWIRGYKEENGSKVHRYGRGVGQGYGTTVTTEDGRIEVDVSDFIKRSGEGIYLLCKRSGVQQKY